MSEMEPASLDSHLGYWMRLVSNRVSGEFARLLALHDVSVAEWVALRQLHDHKLLSPSELAHGMGMTQGAISKIADKLTSKGWIAIEENLDDRRGRFIQLTESGRHRVPELAAIANENDRRFFGPLTKMEQSDLRRLLIRLSEIHHLDDIPTN